MFDAPPSDVFIERLFDDAVGLGPRDFSLHTQEAVGAQRPLALWRDVLMRAGVIGQRLFGPLGPGLELARRAVQPTRRVLEFLGLVLDVAVDQSSSELIANGRGERRVGMRVCDLQ